MKKILILLCAFLLLASGVPQQVIAGEAIEEAEYAVEELSGTATITAESLNVRSGPSRDYGTMGKAKQGETYTITGQASTGWYRIDYKGADGYISDEYAEITQRQEETQAPENAGGAEPEEGEGGGNKLSDYGIYITGGIILIIIVIILISIGITVKKMLAGDDYEEEYDSGEENDDEEDEDDEEENDGEYDAREEKPWPVKRHNRKKTGSVQRYQETVLPVRTAEKEKLPAQDRDTGQQEEDYRIFIDPRYFEDDTPEGTEAPVVANLSRPVKPAGDDTDRELEAAMKKLNELQLEIERIKAKKKGDM